MRKKELKYLVTFYTTAGAMAMEKACKSQQIPGRLIPVPRELWAGCGIAWSAPPEVRPQIEELMEKQKLEIEGTYEIVI
ncbi:MAG: DUF3343 domain-containing protein [Lachnospiraceae bacterium]|nr:DUF3343 domain-containing protein [Lachnospiraceae bacterium]